MRYVIGTLSLALLVGCTPPVGQSNHQNLNVQECRKIAEETFRSGRPNYDQCPGYMPDGQVVEQF